MKPLILSLLVCAVSAGGVSAQPRAVTDCSLINDPTLSRACVESFRQQGPAQGVNVPVLNDGALPGSGRAAVPVVPGKKGAKGKAAPGAAKSKAKAPASATGDAPTEMP